MEPVQPSFVKQLLRVIRTDVPDPPFWSTLLEGTQLVKGRSVVFDVRTLIETFLWVVHRRQWELVGTTTNEVDTNLAEKP